MITTTLSLDWLGIYKAYAESGLNKQEFYSCRLSSLLPPSAKRPPAKEFYSTLRLLEQLAANKQLRFSDKQDDEIVRVATFSPQALESVPNLPTTYVDEPEEEPYVRSIRMTVPNGTILEFESTNPEQFALQLMHQSVEVK